MDPILGIDSSDEETQSTVQRAEVHHLSFGRVEIELFVDASPGCGGRAWPAGEVLSSYLVRHRTQSLHTESILEIGSGTGLVGLVAAKLGAAHVCITDQKPLIPIMRESVRLNDLSSEQVSVAELNWGDPLPLGLRQPSLILAADCVYFEPAFPLLVKTLVDLCNMGEEGDPEILFCYKKRRKADKRFFLLLKKHFTWSPVPDDPSSLEYNRDSILLFSLKRRNSIQ